MHICQKYMKFSSFTHFCRESKSVAIYALYPESFCMKNLAIRKICAFSDSAASHQKQKVFFRTLFELKVQCKCRHYENILHWYILHNFALSDLKGPQQFFFCLYCALIELWSNFIVHLHSPILPFCLLSLKMQNCHGYLIFLISLSLCSHQGYIHKLVMMIESI